MSQRRVEGCIEIDPAKRYVLIIAPEDTDAWQEALAEKGWDNVLLSEPGEIMAVLTELQEGEEEGHWDMVEDEVDDVLRGLRGAAPGRG